MRGALIASVFLIVGFAFCLASRCEEKEPNPAKQESIQQVAWPQYVTWVLSALALCAGGLGGTVLTLFVAYIRNRKQPIEYRLDPGVSSFRRHRMDTKVQTLITLVYPDIPNGFIYDNLTIMDGYIVNRSNKDFEEFRAGVTLEGEYVVYAECETHRHQSIVFDPPPDPPKKLTELDIVMHPFNRGDVCRFRLFIETPGDREHSRLDEVTTPEVGVKMVRIPPLAEILEQLSKDGHDFARGDFFSPLWRLFRRL